MKKIICIFLLFFILITNLNIKAKPEEKIKIEPDLLYNSLIYTMYPYIRDEIIKYYGFERNFAYYYNEEIKSITPKGNHYEIVFLVTTYEHAHNPPYGKETISFDLGPTEIKTNYFIHVGDEYEILRENFYQEVIDDIVKTHKLNLKDYNKIIIEQIRYRARDSKEYKSIESILDDIVMNIQKQKIVNTYKNVIAPLTFIKDNNGYILFKLIDGTNIVYKIKLENGVWNVLDKTEMPGKVMEYSLSWYM